LWGSEHTPKIWQAYCLLLFYGKYPPGKGHHGCQASWFAPDAMFLLQPPVLACYNNNMIFVNNIIRNDVFESDYHFPVSSETNFSHNKIEM